MSMTPPGKPGAAAASSVESPNETFARAMDLHKRGLIADAQRMYGDVLRRLPDHLDSQHMLGVTYIQMKEPHRAIPLISGFIRRSEPSPAAHNNLGCALRDAGRPQDALAQFERAIQLAPRYADAHLNRGRSLVDLGKEREALAQFDHAISAGATTPDIHFYRGFLHQNAGRHQEAVLAYQTTLSLDPRHLRALNNMGLALIALDRFEASFDALDRAVKGDGKSPEFWYNRGNALSALRRGDEAIASYDRALELAPEFAEAYRNRGNQYREKGNLAQALTDYSSALRIKPGLELLLGDWLYTRMKLCEWDGFADALESLKHRLSEGVNAASPFVELGLIADARLHLQTAQTYVTEKFGDGAGSVWPAPARFEREKIVVAYYSSDFWSHPVSHLIVELFESHDRAQFDVHLFSFGPPRNDPMRDRIRASGPAFRDVAHLTDSEIIHASRALGVDIAVDLNGFTQNCRTRLFHGRCAPVQVNYLGHPGTMGADFMDYIVADRVVIPEEHQPFYREKVIYMPVSFQVNDSQRKISPQVMTRAEAQLPERAFVFCCFNACYKIQPDLFSAWMRILQNVPGSVLWLFEDVAGAGRNLRREAAARGIDPARLVFAPKLPYERYLARYRLADLFLDTVPYNAGATASDALWAGLPVLTCLGDAFSGRMAASLLTAVGLPELICRSMDEYERTAVSLAAQPDALQMLVRKLAAQRLASPLFSGRRFARDIETAYRHVHERRLKGLGPEHVFVS